MALPVDFVIGNPANSMNLKNEENLGLSITRDPHGDAMLDFQLCNWANRLPDLDESVTIRHPTYGYIWSGYVGRVVPGGFFGKPTKIQARGWRNTLNDDAYDASQIWEEGTANLATIVMSVMSRMRNVKAGIPLPSGLNTFTLSEDTKDFILQTIEDVLDFVCDQTKYLSTALLWEVRNSLYSMMSDQPSLYVRFLDIAPKYQVTLTENDEFGPPYDVDTIFNRGIVGWGPRQVEAYTVEASSARHQFTQRIRAKRVQASADISTTADARNMARYLSSRNNTLRPIDSNLVLHCDTPIEAQYPVVPVWTGSVPHYMVLTNYYIRVLNPFDTWGQYNVREFFISDTRYDFETGSLSLSLGDPISYDSFPLQQSYQVNRINSALDSSVVSQPLRDADTIPTIGPDKAGDSPPTIGEVIPMAYLDQDGNFISVVDPDKPALPFGAVIHPKVLPDYGVQANFGREADSVGTKGFIQVVPCKVLAWNVCFTPPAGSDTVPTDSITVQLYPSYPFTVGINVLATCTLAAAQCGSGTIPVSALQSFAQRSKIGVRVSVAAGTAGSGFQVAVTGKRVYPDIGVTT